MGAGGRQDLGANLKPLQHSRNTRNEREKGRAMATTYIDANACPRLQLPGSQGTVAVIVNRHHCGAENVVGSLRWLTEGEEFQAEILKDKHQLIYFMEGDGRITLKEKSYSASKGVGIYLGPSETATIRHTGGAAVKLFHLVVRKG